MSARAVKLILATKRLQDAYLLLASILPLFDVSCAGTNRTHIGLLFSSKVESTTGRITELRPLEFKEPVFEGSMVVKVFFKPHRFYQVFHAVQVCTGKVSNKCCYMYGGTYFSKPTMDIFACMSI